ncbi:membrane protein, putative [Arcticibacter svalbardensis MN12-7]|uniref:histidine kinase n=1 Tax=Arcticibacter svalbardensis MN12-7 TaxID=1150600 RepID=R9H2Y6_9SPHI|nr:HAMP domain-containing sensor histidine kinase [Arcticibacter svalbardensis]EOR95559.1 membrane protein, putative [Arcticibacter svalbardensis MN12-7]
MQSIKDFISINWVKLIGSKEHFSLEQRIFHAACILPLLICLLNIFVNLYLQLYNLAALMFALHLIMLFLYYISRVKMKTGTSITVYCILGNAMFAINFYFNSGSNGPTTILFLILFLITIIIAQKNQARLWIILNLLTIVALLLFENYYPNLIEYTYKTRNDRYADIIYTYIAAIFIMSFIIKYMLDSYKSEHNKVKQKAIELDLANNTKNKLFSILAHDLRSPLNNIHSYLEIISQIQLPGDERQTLENDLLKTTENTQQMLSNLLSWSSSQLEGFNVKLQNTRLNDALSTTFKVQKNIASQKKIDLDIQLDPDACILADPNMLEVIVRNIINNAIKFTPSPGKITIQTIENPLEWIIKIADNGIGIKIDRQHTLFTLEGETTYGTNNEKGAGLGLVLCRDFAKLQKAKIWFESIPNEGNTFYVSFNKCQNSSDSVDKNAPFY